MIKEVGLLRMVKYLVFGLWDGVFRLLPWSPLRLIWMKIAGAKVAWSAVVERVTFMNLDRIGLPGLEMGKRAYLGPGVVIDLAGRVSVGRDVTIAPAAVILSHLSVGFHSHPLIGKYPKKVEQTIIRRGSFVGANSTVLSGVAIGERSMVAAGSVVTEDVPSHTMVAGVPAEVKKRLK